MSLNQVVNWESCRALSKCFFTLFNSSKACQLLLNTKKPVKYYQANIEDPETLFSSFNFKVDRRLQLPFHSLGPCQLSLKFLQLNR